MNNGYPMTYAPDGSITDYFNPLVYKNARTTAATTIANNWSIYNVAFYQQKQPCVTKKPPFGNFTSTDYNSAYQCYVNVNHNWPYNLENSGTYAGRSRDFYQRSNYHADSSTPTDFATPFDAFVKYQQGIANASINNVVVDAAYLSSTDPSGIIKTIAQDITDIYTYSSVEIRLPLSKEVELTSGTTLSRANLTAYKQDENTTGSTPVQIALPSNIPAPTYDATTRTVVAKIPNLDPGVTITLKVPINPTSTAYDERATAAYPNIGEAATGVHEAEPGFFVDTTDVSNPVNATAYKANLVYSVQRESGVNGTVTEVRQTPVPYARPVVQVTMNSIPVTKEWRVQKLAAYGSLTTIVDPSPSSHSAVRLQLLKDGVEVTGKTVFLYTTNSWKATFADLAPGHKYTFKEVEVLPN